MYMWHDEQTELSKNNRTQIPCADLVCILFSTAGRQSAIAKRSYEDITRTNMQDTSDILMATCGQNQASVHVHHASPTASVAAYKILPHAAA